MKKMSSSIQLHPVDTNHKMKMSDSLLSELLRPAKEILHDPRVEICREQNQNESQSQSQGKDQGSGQG